METKRLLKKTGIYFVGNLSSKFLNALLLPIYAFYITKNEMGSFDYSQTIMNIFVIVVYVAIWEAILKFILTEEEEVRRNEYISSSVIFCVIISFILLIGTTVLFFITGNTIILATGIMSIFYGLAQIWQYFSRAMKHNTTYVVSGIVATIINFLFIIIFVILMRLGFFGLTMSYTLGRICTLLFIESKIHLFRQVKIENVKFNAIKKMILFSAPLVLNLMSSWLISGFSRVIIKQKFGTDMMGLYSFADKFSLIITMIGSVVTMALIEETILSSKKKDLSESFSKTNNSIFNIFLDIGFISIPVVYIFYQFISRTVYIESIYFVPILIIYAIFQTGSSNIGSMFQAIDKTKYQFISTFIGSIITITISITFIQYLGIYSVLLGQITGMLCMLLLRWWYINRFVTVRLQWKKFILKIITYIILFSLSFAGGILINIFLALVILGYCIHSYREYIIVITKYIMRRS